MFRTIKAFTPILRQQASSGFQGTRIMNLTSMAGLAHPFPGTNPYMASKHAANILSQGVRLELAPFGIQVCSVNPSFHETPLVAGMSDQINKQFQSLPEEIKKVYGEGTLITMQHSF